MAKACAYLCRQCCFIDSFGEFRVFCQQKLSTNQQLALLENWPIFVSENRTGRIWPILSADCVGRRKSADFSWQTTDFRRATKSADENRSSVLSFRLIEKYIVDFH